MIEDSSVMCTWTNEGPDANYDACYVHMLMCGMIYMNSINQSNVICVAVFVTV